MANFTVGDNVEVTSPVPAMRGALFPAKIIAATAAAADRAHFTVEYNRVKTRIYRKVTGHRHRKLRDDVDAALLRPPLPRVENDESFKLSDAVDAYFAGGWWEGVVTKVLDESRFEVYFRFAKERFEFEADEMRVHREWVDGSWVPPISEDRDLSTTKQEKKRRKGDLGKGAEVEVSSDEDGFQGAWFAANVVEVLGEDRFLIRYKSLKTEDDKELLAEEVDAQHIRPCPPETLMVDCYRLKEEVDAFYNDGWWEGVICKVLHGGRYKVYFEGTGDKMDFDHCDLRPRQDWIDQTWVMASQVVR